MADTPPRSTVPVNDAAEWLLTEPENSTSEVSARQYLSTTTPDPQSPAKQFLTVPEAALQLGASNDYVRGVVVFLLERGALVGKVDVLQIKPLPGARRTGRKYRQFRIHRVTGMEKLKAFLAP